MWIGPGVLGRTGSWTDEHTVDTEGRNEEGQDEERQLYTYHVPKTWVTRETDLTGRGPISIPLERGSQSRCRFAVGSPSGGNWFKFYEGGREVQSKKGIVKKTSWIMVDFNININKQLSKSVILHSRYLVPKKNKYGHRSPGSSYGL